MTGEDWKDALLFVLECSTENALYNLRNSLELVRRLSKSPAAQKIYAELQRMTKEELERRARADED